MSQLNKYKRYLKEDYKKTLPKSSKYYKRRRVSSSSSSSEDGARPQNDNSNASSSAENEVDVNYDQRINVLQSIATTSFEDVQRTVSPIIVNHQCDDQSHDDRLTDEEPAHNENHLLYENYFEDYIYDSTDGESDYEENNDEYAPNIPQYFTKLSQTIESEDANRIIKSKFVVSKVEVLLAITKFSLEYSLPNSAMADLCKMVNAFLDVPIIPDSRYQIDKLFYPGENVEYHATCPICKSYIKPFNKTMRTVLCTVCESQVNVKDPSYRDFFIVSNVDNEIKNLIESNADYYDAIMSQEQIDDNLKDIRSGHAYKQFVRSLPNEQRKSYLTLTFNSDGSPVFKSSKFSIWPIQLIPNELSLHIRNSKTIKFAMWFGHDKPDMTSFLTPFVNYINRLSRDGIACKIKEEVRNVHVYALCCCVDSVARAPMQGFMQFNAYFGCNWCLHPGELVQHNIGASVKYPLLNEVVQRRSEADTLKHVEEALNTCEPYFGVKKPTPSLNLEKFNIIDGFVPDAMHCICLGIAKKFSEYWFNTSDKEYSLSHDDLLHIDKQIKCLKVPIEIMRLSRSIFDRKYWKSKEWENWLLYYSLPLLKDINHMKTFLDHWVLLVEAFHILMQDSISAFQLNKASNNLLEFVALTEQHYTKDAMTFNVHQLLHLCRSVIDWGPLWAHCGYPFESGNGQILRTVHAAKGVLNQVCRNMSMNEGITMLEKHVSSKEDSSIMDFCYYLQNRCTERSVKLNNNRYFGKSYTPNKRFIQQLNLCEERTEAYKKLVKNKMLFKSSKNVCYRSNNSFAQTIHGDFIQILQFLIDRRNKREYTVCKRIEVQDILPGVCASLKEIVNIENESIAIETRSVEKICVHMLVKKNQYISAVPNVHLYS